jgi:hypothetical protein
VAYASGFLTWGRLLCGLQRNVLSRCVTPFEVQIILHTISRSYVCNCISVLQIRTATVLALLMAEVKQVQRRFRTVVTCRTFTEYLRAD